MPLSGSGSPKCGFDAQPSERLRAERAETAAMPRGFVTRQIGEDYSAAERERRLQAYERPERQTRMRGRYV